MKIHYQLTAAEFSKGSSDGQILFIKKQKKVPVLRWVITILLIAFYSIFFVLFYKQHSLVLNLLAALANGSYDFSGYGGYEYFRFGITFTFWGFVVAGLILLGRFSFLRASRGIFSFDKLYQDKSPLFSPNTVELRDNGIYHETEAFQSLHFYKHICSVEETKDWIFIFLEKSIFKFLPKSAFQNTQQIHNFINQIKENINKK
ncbi:TPA: YcxB family protein [Neisseria elongata]